MFRVRRNHEKFRKKSKGGEIVRARDYWIFLVDQHQMSRLEMDGIAGYIRNGQTEMFGSDLLARSARLVAFW